MGEAGEMVGDVWCPSCARSGRPVVAVAARAWMAGCLGAIATLAVLLVGLFVIVFAVATAGSLSADDGEALAYALTSSALHHGGLLVAMLLPIVVGGAVVRSRRRRVCPTCRAAYPQ